MTFYGDLVYKLKQIVDSTNFSAQFIKIISHYRKIGYNHWHLSPKPQLKLHTL